MKIKVAYDLWRDIQFIKSVLKKHSTNMVGGRYVLLPCMRALVLDDPAVATRADAYFGNKSGQPKFQPIISFFNKINFFRVRNDHGKYSAIYIANNHDKQREIKLFSFDSNTILTVCTSPDIRQAEILRYENLSSGFAMPAVKAVEGNRCAFEISMVQLHCRPSESEALGEIAKCNIKFSQNIEKLTTVRLRDAAACQHYSKEINQCIQPLIEKIPPRLLDAYFPLCVQHGDLSQDNLIYGTSEGRQAYWWIDWEHAGERVFCYDFFFYILNAAVCSNDTSPLELYLSGKCDEVVREYFKHFGVNFDEKYRKELLLAVAVIFLKERVCDLGNLNALKRYCEFLLKYECEPTVNKNDNEEGVTV